jgi:hypothetical protein
MAGSDECVWAALPDGKFAVLDMTDEVWSSGQGSMVNVVGPEAFVAAFESCSAGDEDYGGPATQSFDQYVGQLRAEKALAELISPSALDSAFRAIPEEALRESFKMLFLDRDAGIAQSEATKDLFLASLPPQVRQDGRLQAEAYLRARIGRFTWSVLMPERMAAAGAG